MIGQNPPVEYLVRWGRLIPPEQGFRQPEALVLTDSEDQMDRFLLSIWQPIQSAHERSRKTVRTGMGSIC